jgi:prepilin-type N-terminal cleavage/methylation domain-containing protein
MRCYFRSKFAVLIRSVKPSAIAGFSLLEVLVVVVIIAGLAAIAAPGWGAFLMNQRLNMAQDQVYQAMLKTKDNARRGRVTWQASFRDQNNTTQWVIHPASDSPSSTSWNTLDSALKIDSETTLLLSSGVYRVQFDQEGNVAGSLGGITLSSRQGGTAKRCVIVSTLIGSLRKGTDHQTTDSSGKYCY